MASASTSPPPAGEASGAAAASPSALQPDPPVRTERTWTIFAAIVALRLVNSLLVRTFFQPDEYFQALEPAWNIAYGPESGAWLTWVSHHDRRLSLEVCRSSTCLGMEVSTAVFAASSIVCRILCRGRQCHEPCCDLAAHESVGVDDLAQAGPSGLRGSARFLHLETR